MVWLPPEQLCCGGVVLGWWWSAGGVGLEWRQLWLVLVGMGW
jgi:hypothetical protein